MLWPVGFILRPFTFISMVSANSDLCNSRLRVINAHMIHGLRLLVLNLNTFLTAFLQNRAAFLQKELQMLVSPHNIIIINNHNKYI